MGTGPSVIDVVGNFGSRLSYATVADRVTRALLERGVLGTIVNLDDRFMDADLAQRPRTAQRGQKVMLLSNPLGYMVDMLVEQYGRENVAIFLCPNTLSLGPEHRASCFKVGRIYTPSKWCADTIVAAVGFEDDRAPVEVMPLGVDDPFVDRWTGPVIATRDGPVTFLHMTTDTFWPGRKGTEELLHAWKMFLNTCRLSSKDVRLTVHCLPKLHPQIYQLVGDLGLLDEVEIESSDARGMSPDRLYDLMREWDVLVAPSRSEGFGVMPLSALCSGRAVCTTAGTGQDEYLFDDEVPAKNWIQIPTRGYGPLAGEFGDAPVVGSEQMVPALLAAKVMTDGRMFMPVKDRAFCAHWSWRARAAAWAASLIRWKDEE